jgi:hypothetical protein
MHHKESVLQEMFRLRRLARSVLERSQALLASAILLGTLFFGSVAFAQSGAGSIEGSVHDPSGALMNNAQVIIVDTATGEERRAQTNSTGFFTVPSLFAGPYSVNVTAQGMSPYHTTLTLLVGQTAVLSPVLKVGGVNSQVTVQGDQTQLINYADATVSTNLERQRIEQIPINGRSLSTLVGLSTPGVEGQSVNGQVGNAQEYVLDGAVVANVEQGGVTFRQPDPDSIQEVRVETSNSSAKFDLPSTTILTTKSGTNSFHGSLFETNRNNGYGIARLRQDAPGRIAPKYIRNEFGASVGGPIIIPKIYNGREHAFFFIAYERQEQRQAVTQQLFVPTVAMRAGNFGGLTNSSGQPIVIYDPATTDAKGQRTPFNYGGPTSCTAAATSTCTNVIDPSRISPLAKTLYAVSPLPTLNVSSPYAANGFNFTGTTPIYISAPTLSGRLDYRPTEHNSFYLRGSHTIYNQYSLNQPGQGPPTTDLNANITHLPTYTNSGALGFSHVFSPQFFSELVFSNNWETDLVYTGTDPNNKWATQLGLPNNFNASGYPLIIGASNCTPGGSCSTNSILENYASADNTRRQTSQILQIDENLMRIFSNNTLTFGGRYRRDHIDTLPDQTPNASVAQFSGLGTGSLLASSVSTGGYSVTPNTGLATADFYLGNATSYTVGKLHAAYQFINQEIAGYVQDDWRALPNLTINVGLRYEAHPTVHELNNSVPNFDLARHAIVIGQPLQKLIDTNQTTQGIVTGFQNAGITFETADVAGLPERLVYSNLLNFAPRIGVALRPFGSNHSTVIRGGFGTYLYPIPVRNFYFNTLGDAPYAAQFTNNQASSSQAGTDGLPNYILRSNQKITAGANSSTVIDSSGVAAINPGNVNMTVVDPHSPASTVLEVNGTLEQQLKDKLVLRLTYDLSSGYNLEQNWNYNTAPSAYVSYVNTGLPLCSATNCRNPYDTHFNGITVQRHTGYANDNSAQVNLQRTFSNGYGYQVFYVFSSAFRNGGNGFRDSFVNPLADYANGYAPSSLDEENRILNYQRNTSIPRHRIRGNWVMDLPVGRGKKYLAGAPRWLDELVGGFQLAGTGTYFSQQFLLGSGNRGSQNPLKIYKHGVPIQDCRSGICVKGFQYFNGYIPSGQVEGGVGSAASGTKVVSGLTSDPPYSQPIDTRYYLPGTATLNSNYSTNNVIGGIPLNGYPNAQNVAFNPGPGTSPYTKTVLQGPNVWSVDASIFKNFTIVEGVNLKVNLDAFNLFNVQGDTNPNATTGIQTFLTSVNAARQLQITVRLSF